jgi:flagellar motility protein MotE (MotC chaperone)
MSKLYNTVSGPYSNVTITSAGVDTTPSTGPYTINASHATSISPWVSSTSTGELQLSGENADVVINGKSLGRAIAKIEERLNILVPNPELEAEWKELQALGDQYRALEQKIKDKKKTWEILNK